MENRKNWLSGLSQSSDSVISTRVTTTLVRHVSHYNLANEDSETLELHINGSPRLIHNDAPNSPSLLEVQ